MTDHCRDEQDNNQRRQKPDRADDQIAWQRQINCAHRQKGQERLPARLRFVDVIVLIRHNAAIAKIYGRANPRITADYTDIADEEEKIIVFGIGVICVIRGSISASPARTLGVTKRARRERSIPLPNERLT